MGEGGGSRGGGAACEEGGPKHGLHDIKVSLDSVMRKLHEWSRKKIGNVTKEIEKSRSRLEELMNMNADRSVALYARLQITWTSCYIKRRCFGGNFHVLSG